MDGTSMKLNATLLDFCPWKSLSLLSPHALEGEPRRFMMEEIVLVWVDFYEDTYE